MAQHDIIVIGASAGGVEALRTIIPMLPANLPAAGIIVVHRQYMGIGLGSLPEVVGRRARVAVCPAEDGQTIEKGHLYVAPRGSHLLINRGLLHLEKSPKENFNRPSIDVLFRSAAFTYGPRVIGVVLSGTGADGSAGLWQIKDRGGITIAQDPEDAGFGSMPESAIKNVPIDYTLPAEAIAPKLIELTAAAPDRGKHCEDRVRVLVVEDEFVLAHGLESDLLRLGYEVVGCVPTGEEAVAMAKSATPDIVLMDVRLGGEMRGTEAAARIWQSLQIPVIFTTAYADQQTLEEAKGSMPFGYVVKPTSPEQIHAAIQIALDRHHRDSFLESRS